MSQNNLLLKRDMDSQLIREEDQELNDFYHEMQISLNPSLSNLDGRLEERFYSTTDQLQDNRRNYFIPYQVKNILACYQEENFNSHDELDMIEDKNLDCENIINRGINSNLSFSSIHQRMYGETSSSGQLTQQEENDLLNDLSSTEKFDFFEIEETSMLKQKYSNLNIKEGFLLNYTQNPYTNEVQKGANRIFIQKRIEEIKNKNHITQKLQSVQYNKKQEVLQTHNNNCENTINISFQGSNINPLQIQKVEQYDQKQYTQQKKDEFQNEQINQTNNHITHQNDQNQDIFQANIQQPQQESTNLQKSPLKMSTIPCKCRKSMCLKLYCECFARGEICGPSCICLECRNSIEHNDLRNASIKQIENKNPTAFLLNGIYSQSTSNISDQSNDILQIEAINEIRKGCNCRKSKCQKKYCECFIIGKQCTSYCQCINCANNIPLTENNSQSYQSPKSGLVINKDMSKTNQLKSLYNQGDLINNNHKDRQLLLALKDINNNDKLIEEKNQSIKSASQNVNSKSIYNKNEDNNFYEISPDDNKMLQEQDQNVSISNQLNSNQKPKANNNNKIANEMKGVGKTIIKKKKYFNQQRMRQKQIYI